ncbi:hypothetical protein SAMD00019534_107920 [Acytostelium subglobosum LB1]|uniref:hypothetical protein n=1 Tax=Acytostelium subglobosum LB1 TaxID=1410327 RepID=UPI0006448E37|nr:hypothetical protein SAMD00019534_107920 [Acytostelium subglobosum LB1]GAM27616.1 hypothetical protein SAMD00019534_107920 [Acytostelium subglobosum LB1]|eukprot:XP_012749275.1 hypothetical protein SAMD00019534_107920 [Acytostelium subglobosum LB1]
MMVKMKDKTKIATSLHSYKQMIGDSFEAILSKGVSILIHSDVEHDQFGYDRYILFGIEDDDYWMDEVLSEPHILSITFMDCNEMPFDQEFWTKAAPFFEKLSTRNDAPHKIEYKLVSGLLVPALRVLPITSLSFYQYIMQDEDYEVMGNRLGDPSHLPLSLTTLKVNNDYNFQPGLDLSRLTRLKTLSITYYGGTQLTKYAILPPSLTTLLIGRGVVEPLGKLPPSVTELNLDTLTYDLSNDHQTLEKLDISKHCLETNILSKLVFSHLRSLTVFSVDSKLLEDIFTLSLFPALEEFKAVMTVGWRQSQPLDFTLSSSPLKKLTITNCHQPILAPNCLQTLSVHFSKRNLPNQELWHNGVSPKGITELVLFIHGSNSDEYPKHYSYKLKQTSCGLASSTWSISSHFV